MTEGCLVPGIDIEGGLPSAASGSAKVELPLSQPVCGLEKAHFETLSTEQHLH